MTDSNREDPWLTVNQVAEQLQVDPQTVRIWLNEGRLAGYKAGARRWRVRQSEVDRMLGAQRTPASEPIGDGAARGASLQPRGQIVIPDRVGE